MQRAKGEDAFVKMLRLAMEKGKYRKGNREVEAPQMRTIHTLEGPRVVTHGVITCWYYWSKVYAVDFDEQRITHFGMPSYSISTAQNINGWGRAFRTKFGPTLGDNVFWGIYRWSFDVAKTKDPIYLRFVRRVPWVHIDRNGIGWFHWPKYDEALAESYQESRDYLRAEQNWRYFEFDWTPAGTWERKFIDDAAKRRWEARERKRQRTHGHLS